MRVPASIAGRQQIVFIQMDSASKTQLWFRNQCWNLKLVDIGVANCHIFFWFSSHIEVQPWTAGAHPIGGRAWMFERAGEVGSTFGTPRSKEKCVWTLRNPGSWDIKAMRKVSIQGSGVSVGVAKAGSWRKRFLPGSWECRNSAEIWLRAVKNSASQTEYLALGWIFYPLVLASCGVPLRLRRGEDSSCFLCCLFWPH